MAKVKQNRSSTGKMITGALIAGALGVAAGMLLAPQSGKKTRKAIQGASADFYKFIAPKIKGLKSVGDKEYAAIVKKALVSYGKLKKLSATEINRLKKDAERHWKVTKKYF